MSSSFGNMSYGPQTMAYPSDRANFIIKTYLHLFGAIGAFVALLVFYFTTPVAAAILAMIPAGQAGWLLVLGGFMLVGWLASRTAATAQSLTAQYAALAIFVLAESVIFVPLIWAANTAFPGALQNAAIVTMLGFTALTAVAFITRQDFSFLRGILVWGAICALGLIVAAAIFGFQLGIIFVVAMIAFAGAAILYDTSNVLHHYPEDRYVGASLELFSSVALLFWYVLRLFMNRD